MLKHVFLVLVIGAVLSAGLAWGAALFAPPDRMQSPLAAPNEDDLTWWQVRIPLELLTIVSERESPQSVLVCHDGSMFEVKQYAKGNWILHVTAIRVRAGWPFRAFEGSQWSGDITRRNAPVSAAEGAWLMRSKWLGERVVPWRPMRNVSTRMRQLVQILQRTNKVAAAGFAAIGRR